MPFRLGTNRIGRLVVGSTAAAWTPASFTDVKYWWTADEGITESGGTITAWEDQIGGIVLEDGSGPGATYTTSATLNGENVVSFNGTSQFLTTLGASSYPESQGTGEDITIMSVFNLVDVKTGGVIQGASIIGSGRAWIDTLNGDIRNFNEDYPSPSATGTVLESTATTGARFLKWRYDNSAGDSYYALDTLTESSLATGGTTGQVDWSTSTSICMGATMQSNGASVFSSRYVQMEMAEQVWINNSPSTDEMNEWKTYVNNKYGTIIS